MVPFVAYFACIQRLGHFEIKSGATYQISAHPTAQIPVATAYHHHPSRVPYQQTGDKNGHSLRLWRLAFFLALTFNGSCFFGGVAIMLRMMRRDASPFPRRCSCLPVP